MQTVILRHRKENLKKCSLRGLEGREDMLFLTYPTSEFPELPNYILLTVDAPPLTKDDCGHGLLLLDGTWRYAEKMHQFVTAKQEFIMRSIPKEWKTAYPRRQEVDAGLASVEALYAAYTILGKDTEGLLDHYYWKDDFLR